jgi:serralysin
MSDFNFTINDPSGVDLSLFFPGLFLVGGGGSSKTSTTQGHSDFRLYQGGILDQSHFYRIAVVGQGLDFAINQGFNGFIASAVLTVHEPGFLPRQLASLSINLEGSSAVSGGVRVGSTLDMTPDTLMRTALAFEDSSGSSSFNVQGGAGNDRIIGSSWHDRLDGSGGRDVMEGGRGDDFYVVNQNGDADVVIERGGEGFDVILANQSYVLTPGAEVERINTIEGTSPVHLTGNAFGQRMEGNLAGNRLLGLGGNDTLGGLRGNDTLDGGIGNDVLDGGADIDILRGGLGRDVVTGGTARDIFDFNALAETGRTATTRDVIRDFVHLTDDIDLSTIDANGSAAGHAFKFLAAKGAAFTGVEGQLHWSQSNPAGTANDKTIVEGYINGDRRADFQIELTGLLTLTAVDFIL